MRIRRIVLLLLLPTLLFVGCKKDDEDNNNSNQHSITVTSPNGGESWATGSTHDITWSDNNVTDAKVLYSADNGTNWIVLAATTTTNSYSWTTPSVAATTYKIKVVDVSDTTVSDVSDAAFALTDADAASHAFTSTTGGTITTPAGARMTVPVGAVPLTEGGEAGTMVFSIERNNSATVTLPTGETQSSDIYQFGPEGFVLAMPVEIALPVQGTNPTDVRIWRRNPTTGNAEYFGANYDAATHTVSAQTYEFSTWFVTTGAVAQAAGCLNLTNTTGRWLSICVTDVTLEYAAQLAWLPIRGQSIILAPAGTTGWADVMHWYLPQGTYDFCVDYNDGSQYVSETRTGVVVGEPWTSANPVYTDLTVATFTNPTTGRCACIPEPTTSAGTGDIQVTLVWHKEAALDLDLWVMDPDSDWCYYGANTPSGGELDRDNLCGNYENGKPENIYWTETPPAGEYIVAVEWFSDCGNAGELAGIQRAHRGSGRDPNLQRYDHR